MRKLMFETDKYDVLHVKDFMEPPPAIVFLDERMESVMEKFDRTGAWRLPVVDSNMVYAGFLSKTRIMSAYREELKEISQD
jgi:CIC family chloride channel protein